VIFPGYSKILCDCDRLLPATVVFLSPEPASSQSDSQSLMKFPYPALLFAKRRTPVTAGVIKDPQIARLGTGDYDGLIANFHHPVIT